MILKQLDPHYNLKMSLLQALADYLNGAATESKPFHGGRQFPRIDALRVPKKVAGPRVGRLRVYVGTHGPRLYKALTKSDMSNARALFAQIDGWALEGNEPKVAWDGDALTIEAVWPSDLQLNDVPLQPWMRPASGRAVIIGFAQFSEIIAVALDDRAPHMLIGGITGSGKSYLMRSIAYQLSADERAEFVIIDGKGGQGLGILNGIHGQVGPVALTDEQQVNALCWVLREVNARNNKLGSVALGSGEPPAFPPLYVIFDEFQNLLRVNREAAQIVRIIAQTARSANCHLIFGTQYPREDRWGGTGAKFQFDILIALRLNNEHGSRMILGPGQSVSAHELLSRGDALVAAHLNNLNARFARVQCVYVPEAQIRERTRAVDGKPRHKPRLPQWPNFEPGAFLTEARGSSPEPFTPEETAVALWAAANEKGYPATIKALEGVLGYSIGATRFSERFKPLGERVLKVWRALREYE